MKTALHLYYDHEGDFLEIDLDTTRDVIFKNLGKGVFEKIDRKTGKLLGVAIHNFSKRTKNLKTITVPSNLVVH